MSDLDRIIKIQIDRQTTAVPQKGFGVALIVGPESEKPVALTGRVGEYDSETFKDAFDPADAVYKACQAYFGQELLPEKVLVGFVEGTETLTEALDALAVANGSFYAVMLALAISQSEQEELGAWIATSRRIAGVRTADSTALDATTTDVGAVLNSNNYSRIFAFYNGEAATKYPEGALFGRCLPADPGSLTWKFKTLSGIVADVLSGTQRTNLRNKKYNYYNEVGGIDIVEEGWMADGSFIDEIRGVDWIHARMQEAIFARLVNLPKIPYTDKGIDIIVNEMEAVLKRAVDQGILDGNRAYGVDKPLISEIAFNDRASRVLPDLKFSGYLAGAVHEIEIQGVVTV